MWSDFKCFVCSDFRERERERGDDPCMYYNRKSYKLKHHTLRVLITKFFYNTWKLKLLYNSNKADSLKSLNHTKNMKVWKTYYSYKACVSFRTDKCSKLSLSSQTEDISFRALLPWFHNPGMLIHKTCSKKLLSYLGFQWTCIFTNIYKYKLITTLASGNKYIPFSPIRKFLWRNADLHHLKSTGTTHWNMHVLSVREKASQYLTNQICP